MQSSQLHVTKYSFYISPFSLQSVKNLIPMRFTHIDFHTYPKQQELIRITFPTLELVNRHRCPKFHLEIRGRGRGLSEAHFPIELCRENGSFVVGIRHK